MFGENRLTMRRTNKKRYLNGLRMRLARVHIPNGGSRNRLEAANLKKQGVKSGVPDICLPVARGKYHGLYIEMKHGKNSTSEKQEEWIAALREQGYAAVICYGWVPARETLIKYLSMEVQKHE